MGSADRGYGTHTPYEQQIERSALEGAAPDAALRYCGWSVRGRRFFQKKCPRKCNGDDEKSQCPQCGLPAEMLRQEMRDPGNRRATQSDAQVCNPHRFAAGLFEPARQQNLIRQWAAANVAQGIEEIEEIKHSERQYAAQSNQRRGGHRNPSHSQRRRTETIHQPSRKKSKERANHKFAQGIAGGNLRACPAELLDHEIVVIKESPKSEAYDAKKNQKSSPGYLNRLPVYFRAKCGSR